MTGICNTYQRNPSSIEIGQDIEYNRCIDVELESHGEVQVMRFNRLLLDIHSIATIKSKLSQIAAPFVPLVCLADNFELIKSNYQ